MSVPTAGQPCPTCGEPMTDGGCVRCFREAIMIRPGDVMIESQDYSPLFAVLVHDGTQWITLPTVRTIDDAMELASRMRVVINEAQGFAVRKALDSALNSGSGRYEP